jgi:transposase InsO family protein
MARISSWWGNWEASRFEDRSLAHQTYTSSSSHSPRSNLAAREGPWRGHEDVEFATLKWVWWFNHHRLLKPIGHVPPVEYEEAHYRAQEAQTSEPVLN